MADVDMQEGTSTQTRCRSIQERFRAYSSELDEHHDRRERIIKTSRDVTAQSKKVIFNLHRITQSKPERVLRESKAKLEEIQKLLETLQEDLEGERYWRYQRQISPGIQEYVESATFYHFLAASFALATLEDLQNQMPLRLTVEDYLLGVADLTGEVMRYGVNNVGLNRNSGDLAANSRQMADFVRICIAGLDPLAPNIRSMFDKIRVSRASLRKLEDVSYALTVRGAEYANYPEALKELVRTLGSRNDNDDREAED